MRDDIGKRGGWVSHTTLLHFNQLEDLGFISSTMQGRNKIFELEYPPGELLQKIGVISSKLQKDDTLMAQMWEEDLNTLNRLSSLQNPGEGDIYSEDEDPSILEPV